MTQAVLPQPGHRPRPRHWAQVLTLSLLIVAQVILADTDGLLDQGRRAFGQGAFQQAAAYWEQARLESQRQADPKGEILASVSLASAYLAVGHQRRAVEVLELALARAQAHGDARLLARVQERLGAALVVTRQPDRAALLLERALETAKTQHDPGLEAAIQNNLGNLFVTQAKQQEALAAYERSVVLAREADDRQLTAQALCNAAGTAARANEIERAETLNHEALLQIEGLEPSHTKIFLLLTAGQTDRQIPATDPAQARRLLLRAHHSIEQGLALAESLGDRTMQAYALGYLAQVYEHDGQPEVALRLTRRAVFAAQQAQQPEALVQWEWQSARLLSAQGDVEPAMEAYRRAVQTLQPIRSDLSSGYGNATLQQSFRESEGPLFLELADLLLQQATATTDPERQQDLLREARDTVEHLKAVELEDYFCDDCVDVQQAQTRSVESVDEHTAVIYLIPLPARTVVLLGLTSGLSQFEIDLTAQELTAQVHLFRRNLETRTTYRYLAQARQLYDWLIRPILEPLRTRGIDTLVFVPDGALRTIPFASLHDGEQFLIQEFAVGVTPGLALVEPKPLQRGTARLLLNGLSEPVQGFPPLPFVTGELERLAPMYPSDQLFNTAFTLTELQRRLAEEQYSIIHIASHGQFDADVRNTFLLTYDDKLTLNALEALIRPSKYRGRPVELLVLSACQTAAGDDRAALGLAGVAVKAGARSALATLWFVNDQSTSTLVAEVYEQLRKSPSMSKARALQAAQIKLLNDRRYRHPCYWSPFLIIGNWL